MEERQIIVMTDRRLIAARCAHRSGRWECTARWELEHEAPVLPRKAEELREMGRRSGEFLQRHLCGEVTARLVIPASWCLIHTVELAGEDQGDAAAALEFECHVPVELEQLTCAVQKVDPGMALVVAVFTEAMIALLAEWEKAGVAVELITVDALVPWAMRAPGGSQFGGHVLADELRWTVVVREGSGGALPRVRTILSPGRLSPRASCGNGLMLPWEDGGIATEVCGWELSETAMACEGESATGADDGCIRWCDVGPATTELLETVAASDELVDLRQNELAFAGRWRPVRRRLRTAALAALAVLLVAGSRGAWERSRYAAGLGELRERQAGTYRRVFPGVAATASAALRLRSERIKLEALTENAARGAERLPQNGIEAFQVLHEVTSRIPPGVKLNVQEIVLDEAGIRVAGQTTAHGAAGQWVQAINEAPQFLAEPPRTKLRKDGTVDFRILAQRNESHDAP